MFAVIGVQHARRPSQAYPAKPVRASSRFCGANDITARIGASSDQMGQRFIENHSAGAHRLRRRGNKPDGCTLLIQTVASMSPTPTCKKRHELRDFAE